MTALRRQLLAHQLGIVPPALAPALAVPLPAVPPDARNAEQAPTRRRAPSVPKP